MGCFLRGWRGDVCWGREGRFFRRARASYLIFFNFITFFWYVARMV